MSRSWSALASGVLFGAGLAVSQMTNPAKVLAFLDLAGAWDPSLAFVMGAAVLVSAIAVKLHRDGVGPARSGLDRPLIVGSALFGLGWGLAGFCPGPAVAALVSGSLEVVIFVAAMIAGMLLWTLYDRSQAKKSSIVAPI